MIPPFPNVILVTNIYVDFAQYLILLNHHQEQINSLFSPVRDCERAHAPVTGRFV